MLRYGESDEQTPDFVVNAASASLRGGETFYSQNLGIPALREAITQYLARVHPLMSGNVERIAVTSGGVSAIMLSMQLLLDVGDEVTNLNSLGLEF
jgi:aspartate/methionine/tyrosine aminotransferase